jgi:hypothetical protein
LEVLSGVNLPRFAPLFFYPLKKSGRKALFFSLPQRSEMARYLNYIYALVEYVEKTDGFIDRVFEKYEEAKDMQKRKEAWLKKYEPERKVLYKIELYKKGG